jgi:hypothetical protein
MSEDTKGFSCYAVIAVLSWPLMTWILTAKSPPDNYADFFGCVIIGGMYAAIWPITWPAIGLYWLMSILREISFP